MQVVKKIYDMKSRREHDNFTARELRNELISL